MALRQRAGSAHEAFTAARQARSAAQEARWAAEDAAVRANSVMGRAEAAHERGDTCFQIALDLIDNGSRLALRGYQPVPAADLVCQLEAIGWTLSHVGYVSTSDGGGDGIRGIYMFRDASSRLSRRPLPRAAGALL